jgi:hypothetical protein
MASASPAGGASSLVSDCQLMLRFALEEGKELDNELRSWIAILDEWLQKNGEMPISDLPPELIRNAQLSPGKDAAVESPLADAPSDGLLLLLKVHGRLSKLIDPASVVSLRTTETHRRGFMRYLDMPFVVKGAIIAAIICMIGFIATLPKPEVDNPSPVKAAPGSKSKTENPSPALSAPGSTNKSDGGSR